MIYCKYVVHTWHGVSSSESPTDFLLLLLLPCYYGNAAESREQLSVPIQLTSLLFSAVATRHTIAGLRWTQQLQSTALQLL